jgi:squalene-associated FAD-dependent desaturase
MKLAVVGAGWAGLAAAVHATAQGHAVTVLEMAAQPGGRARGVAVEGLALDNGQHILIGAYTSTLALMRQVGADPAVALARCPLTLRYPDGRGLRMPPGPAWLGFGRAVWACQGWTARDRWALISAAARWALAGFRCPARTTVAELCVGLPAAVRELLIDPLCVAALNTPATEASGQVFLRVLRDAVFGGPGSADLLLPRVSLSALLPQPALAWLLRAGADVRLGHRARALEPATGGWKIDGEDFDAVVLACTAAEAARLAAPVAAAWARRAAALRYEPIVTAYLRCPGAHLPEPMMALIEGPDAPAQFAFDHGALGGTPGLFAFVVSGAAAWVEAGLEATGQAVLRQARAAFGAACWPTPPQLLKLMAERRATFRCTPGLDRPPAWIAPRLVAAGDYVEGPYPATLEGAVRSGRSAADEAVGAVHSPCNSRKACSRKLAGEP